MKTAYKLVIAALAAAAALSSCTKDIAADRQDTDLQDGVRTIAISFDTPTKTVLGGPNGLTPQFKGDGSEEIIVSNGNRWQKLTVQKDGNGAYITTELSGKLVAVYPSKYAKIEGVKITGVIVPSNQTGRFADANIAMATIDEGNSSATFYSQAAILRFYVDESIGVQALQIKSDRTVAISDGYLDEEGKLTASSGMYDTYSVFVMPEQETDSLWTLDKQTDDSEKRVCYVAVRPSNTAFTMAVASRTNTQLYDDEIEENAGPLQGRHKGVVSRIFNDVTLSAKTMANVFIPYYIKVDVGETTPEYQYWSYCNIGAFLPEEPGLYFAWGEVKGHKADISKKIEPEDEDGIEFIKNAFTSDFVKFSDIAKLDNRYSGNWNSSDCFHSCNAPYSGDLGYIKYTGSDYETLQPEDDAASVNWGGKWRMPTKGEYEALLLAEKTYSSSGTSGLSFQGEGDKPVFFPAVGTGEKADLAVTLNKKHIGYYWSSTLNDDNDEALPLIFFCEGEVALVDDGNGRYYGLSIRPIYGAPAEEGTSVDIEPIDPLREGRILY